MDKDLKLIELFGLYGKLLTEHQREIFNLYYECDLSLGEIAEIHEISRQSVNDALRKSRDMLYQTEEALGFYSKFSVLNKIVLNEQNYLKQDIIECINKILENN